MEAGRCSLSFLLYFYVACGQEMLQVGHEGKSCFAPPFPRKLQLLFSPLRAASSYRVAQAVHPQCSGLLCLDMFMEMEVNCGEKHRNSIRQGAQAGKEHSKEYILDPKDHHIKPLTQELRNQVLVVEASSPLPLGRETPCVPEGLWLGRGYVPAHLLDFLHCQAYGRAEAREGLLAALSRARLCSTLVCGLLVL